MSARQNGFTLIELIVALTISVVVVGFVATFVAVPVQAHFAQARRSELAASAEAVTHWMAPDVRGALSNSVRTGMIGGRAVVEMVDVAALAIYRHEGGEGDTLDFDPPPTPPDTTFDVLGFPSAAPSHVVINNLGTVGRDAYALADVITPATIQTDSSTITLSDPAFRFAGPSLNRRAFLVAAATAVIRYECDLGAGTLRRYDGLAMTGAIVALPAGTPSRLIARDVTECTFTRQDGNAEHGGLLLLRVTISRVTNGAAESLRVMKQLKVEAAA